VKIFIAFFKKEMIEHARTYRFFILVVIFLLFGIMNPFMAKMMPEILSSVLPEGMNLTLAEPTALDAWAQFFKNASQMGLIIFVIMFGGIITNEFSKGTLVNVLTKGLPRPIVILAKFCAALLVWTASYALSFLATYYYTVQFWSMTNVHHLMLSVAGLWVFGVFLIACLILGGVLIRNHFGGLLFTFALVAVAMILSIAPRLQKFNPFTLASKNDGILTLQVATADFYPALIITAGLTVLFVLLSILTFNKKQI